MTQAVMTETAKQDKLMNYCSICGEPISDDYFTPCACYYVIEPAGTKEGDLMAAVTLDSGEIWHLLECVHD